MGYPYGVNTGGSLPSDLGAGGGVKVDGSGVPLNVTSNDENIATEATVASMLVAFSTTAPLGVGGTYTSPLTVFADQFASQVQTEVKSSGDGTMTFTFYADAGGTVALRTLSVPYLASEGYRQFGAPTFGLSARWAFTDTSGAGASPFYFSTKILRQGVSPQVLALDAFVSPAMLATVGRAIISGQDPAGNFGNVAQTPEGDLRIALASPLTGFDELVVASPTPRVQIDASEGLLDTDVVTVAVGTGATTAVSDNVFSVACGTDAGGYASIRSRRLVRYDDGQALRFRFTAAFDEAGFVADTIQLAGAFNYTDGLLVGGVGATPGVTRRVDGALEIRRLQVTAGASSGEVITVTLGGTAFALPATAGALSANQTAQYIAAQAASFTGWNGETSPQAYADKVVFVRERAGTAPGAYSISGAGGIGGPLVAGAFTQLQAGSAIDYATHFTPQTAFSIDVLDGSKSRRNPSGMLVDWTTLNVFEILYTYLGVGPIEYRIKGPSGRYFPFHREDPQNLYRTTTQRKPTFRLGWISESTGGTTSRTVIGGSAAGFVDGQHINSRRDPFAESVQAFTAGATETAVMALRVSSTVNGYPNLREWLPLTAKIGVETANRAVRVRVVLNPTFGLIGGAYMEWARHSDESCMEIWKGATGPTITGGTEVAADVATSGGNASIDLRSMDLRAEPGDTIAIMVQRATQDAVITAAIPWDE